VGLRDNQRVWRVEGASEQEKLRPWPALASEEDGLPFDLLERESRIQALAHSSAACNGATYGRRWRSFMEEIQSGEKLLKEPCKLTVLASTFSDNLGTGRRLLAGCAASRAPLASDDPVCARE